MNTSASSGPQTQINQAQPQINTPLITESARSPFFQRSPVPLSSNDLLRLNTLVGNRAVQHIMTSRTLQRKPAPLPPGVLNVREAIKRADYITQPSSGAEGAAGAFHYLDQMASEELISTIAKLTAEERALLLENLPQGEKIFDIQRINTALRSAAMRDTTSGQAAVTLDDAIDKASDDIHDMAEAQKISDAIKKAEAAEAAGAGWQGWIDGNIMDIQAPYTDVYALMAALEDAPLQAALAHLSQADLLHLMSHLSDAPADHRARWGALLALLCGRAPNTPMAQDPFQSVLATLAGLSRVDLYKRLRILSRDNRQQLLEHIQYAPEKSRELINEVLVDLQGEETNMESDDVIDLKGLSGVPRKMAQIYNNYGQFLEEQARALDITTAAAAGIMKVESGGETFDVKTERPVIRFENHIFYDRWVGEEQKKPEDKRTKEEKEEEEKRRTRKTEFEKHFTFGPRPDRIKGHMWRADPKAEWIPQHVSKNDQEAEWDTVEKAAKLGGDELAYQSMSIGAGQLMGFNYKKVGCSSAVEMYNFFATGDRPQVNSIFDYILNTEGLAEGVRAGDYAMLARLYNGAGSIEQQIIYQNYIIAAATAYEQVTAGKKHVFPKKEAPKE